jgi:hypothetical protein
MSCPNRRKYEEDADNAKTAWTLSRNDERLKISASDARTLLEKHIRECAVCQGDEKTDVLKLEGAASPLSLRLPDLRPPCSLCGCNLRS